MEKSVPQTRLKPTLPVNSSAIPVKITLPIRLLQSLYPYLCNYISLITLEVGGESYTITNIVMLPGSVSLDGVYRARWPNW